MLTRLNRLCDTGDAEAANPLLKSQERQQEAYVSYKASISPEMNSRASAILPPSHPPLPRFLAMGDSGDTTDNFHSDHLPRD